MKNNKILKMMTGVGLACVSAMGLAGCSDIEMDQKRLDTLLEKAETYVDSQNQIDYKQLAEELQNYIDGQDTKVDYEQMKSDIVKNYLNLIKLSTSQNYTYRTDNEYTRVEYTSDTLTKVYHYTLEDDGSKSHEVYREIVKLNDGFVCHVKTYVKDLNLYSDDLSSNGYDHLLAFDRDYGIWRDFTHNGNYTHIQIKDYYNHDILIDLYQMYSSILEMTPSKLADLLMEYSKIDNQDVFTGYSADFRKGDDHDWEELSYQIDTLKFTDHSYIEESTYFSNNEGVPGQQTQDSDYCKVVFDTTNQNTIEFDTTGYELIDDYLNAQQ